MNSLGAGIKTCACHVNVLFRKHTPNLLVLVVVGSTVYGDRAPIKMHDSMVYDKFTISCNHFHNSMFEHFCSPERSQYPFAVSSGFNPRQSLDYLDICANFYVWYSPAHVMCQHTFLKYLPSSLSDIFSGVIYFCMYQAFIPLHLNSLPRYE